MAGVDYQVIEHDGGWAYQIGEMISARYPSRSAALIAGEEAAAGFQTRREIQDNDHSNASSQKSDGINEP